MNLILVTACLLGLRATESWPFWLYPAVALSILSLEIQFASVVNGAVSLGQLALGHSIVLLIVALRSRGTVLVRRCGDMLRHARALPGCLIGRTDRRVVTVILAIVVGTLLFHALMFLPEAADPYHLVRTAVISATNSLEHVPVEDSKINALGYLYELVLADLVVGADRLEPWLGLQGPLLVCLYIAAVAAVFVRVGARLPWYAFLLVCLVPVVFHQGVLIKNDLFVGLLCLPVLLILQARERLLDRRQCAAAGFMTGLALSAKVTTLPLVLALGVLLPWRPLRDALRTRIAASVGVLSGIVGGGLVLVIALNIADYGSVGGPVSDSGNLNATFADATVSLLRFILSWFDASIFTRVVWPDRGGWGGAFGPGFVWALAVLAVRARHHDRARRALGLTLACLLPFGLAYPDADLAHRMALAPAAFALIVAATIEAEGGAFQSWTLSARAALACALVGLALVGRSATAYLRQIEYLRPPALALAMEPTAGYLASRAAWRLRQANADLGDSRSVCTIMQENVLATRGYSSDAAVITMRTPAGYGLVWRPDALERCDALVVAPNEYPAPDARSAAALARCTDDDTAVVGPDVSIRAIRCAGKTDR